MDLNVHLATFVAQDRLAQLRADAGRHHLVRAADRPSLRRQLGDALVRLGARLAGRPLPVSTTA